MEPKYKLSELLHKKRPVPRKLNIYKEFDPKGHSAQPYNPPDLNTYISKLSITKTPERPRPTPALNYSHIPEIKPLGKENRSSSVSRKEERAVSVKRNARDRQHNHSWLNEKSITVDAPEVDPKKPDFVNKFQIYLSSDRRNAHKRNLSSKRVADGSKPYRRLNSSCVETRQRVPSQDKKIGHIHKNSSLLNNSLMFDEPGNISRDQSYLKELLDEDVSYASEANGATVALSPHKIDDSYVDYTSGMLLNNSRQVINKNYYHEEDQEHNERSKGAPLYEKGKQLFREKKYEEGISFLRDSLQQEEKTIEALYLLGVSYLWLGQYENSIKEFKAFLELQPACHKNIYVLLSIAYKKTSDLPSAIKTLTKAIQKFPKYYDAYIFRGKLYLKEKQWDRALSDFSISSRLQPSKNLALIGQGDALRMLGDHDKAIDAYTHAIERGPSSLSTALLKRGMVLIEARRYDDALKDLEKAISIDPMHSEAYYFKGFVLEKKKDFNEATLCFEQAIKHKSSRKAVLRSLHEIARIKIEQRNFYEAYHTLHRAELLELEEKAFSKLKLFTEGVINLMKRKFEEGIANLSDVIKKQEITDSFRPMAYNYRAYGYFCSNKIKEALEDYQSLQKISKLDQGSTYNKLLCEGILAAEADNIDQALKKFAQALKIFPNKMEPHLYKCVLTVYSYYKSHPKIDSNDLSTALEPVLDGLDKCLELNDNCSNLYYIRALIYYALGSFSLAHQNMEKAIEKADENYAKYYHLRGVIFACSHNYYNAVSDLSIALDLSKDMQASYLERAKCYYTLGDVRQAFMDIQDYITVKSDDSNIHLWAGNLLFSTGAYEDAVKAYSNSETINDSENLLALRVKCNIILKELNLALNDLDRLLELKTENNIYYYVDRECLVALKTTSSSAGEELEKENVMKGIQKLAKVISYKVSGTVFTLYDLYFYKSVFHFYVGEYQEAIDDIDKAWHIKEELEKLEKELGKGPDQETKEMMKLLEETSQSGSDGIKDEVTKAGTFDFKEYIYNKAIYFLMMKRYEESLDLLLTVRSLIATEEALELDILIKLVNDQQNTSPGKISAASPKVVDNGHEIIIFQNTNRLCSIFPAVTLPLSAKKAYNIRLSFCLPQVEAPSFLPEINYGALAELKVGSVENKPEAPWIKRTFGGVVFTEHFTDKEEKEIENLNEIIKINGLKEEEIYKSLANSQRTQTQDSNNLLNQGVIIENEGNMNQDNAMYIAEELFPAGKGKMKRSKTGGV